MTATILEGKKLARELQAVLADKVSHFIRETGVTPRLDVVLAGENPASEVYVRGKQEACRKAGIHSELHRLPIEVASTDLLGLIGSLNRQTDVHGILVQLPLPPQIEERQVLETVSPLKDVDAFHPENVGRIVQGWPRFLPCTPHGVMQLLARYSIQTAGRHAVVVGRSEIVGKPLAIMLMQKGADATVTVCHSKTRDLADVTRRADILIAAIGRPRMITAEMVKPGAAVIDVGINRTGSGLVGDVDFEAVKEVAGHITPVPGGVGPLTIAMLLENTLLAAGLQTGQ